MWKFFVDLRHLDKYRQKCNSPDYSDPLPAKFILLYFTHTPTPYELIKTPAPLFYSRSRRFVISRLFKTFSSIFILLMFYYIYAQYRFLPFQLLYLESGFLSIGYLTAANLARLVISVHCLVSGRSQYLVRLLSLCPITEGHTIYPPIEGLYNQRAFNPHRSEIQPPIYFIYLFILLCLRLTYI